MCTRSRLKRQFSSLTLITEGKTSRLTRSDWREGKRGKKGGSLTIISHGYYDLRTPPLMMSFTCYETSYKYLLMLPLYLAPELRDGARRDARKAIYYAIKASFSRTEVTRMINHLWRHNNSAGNLINSPTQSDRPEKRPRIANWLVIIRKALKAWKFDSIIKIPISFH